MQAHRRDASREKGYFGLQEKSQQQLPATLDIVAPATLNRPPAPDKDRGKLDAPEVSAGRAAVAEAVPHEMQAAGVPGAIVEDRKSAQQRRTELRRIGEQAGRFALRRSDLGRSRQQQRGDLGVLNHHRLPAPGLRHGYEDGHSAANRIRLRTCVRHVPNTQGRNLSDAEPAIMRQQHR